MKKVGLVSLALILCYSGCTTTKTEKYESETKTEKYAEYLDLKNCIQPQSCDNIIQADGELKNKGYSTDACKLMEDYVKMCGCEDRYYFYVGKCHMRSHRYEKAISFYEKAIKFYNELEDIPNVNMDQEKWDAVFWTAHSYSTLRRLEVESKNYSRERILSLIEKEIFFLKKYLKFHHFIIREIDIPHDYSIMCHKRLRPLFPNRCKCGFLTWAIVEYLWLATGIEKDSAIRELLSIMKKVERTDDFFNAIDELSVILKSVHNDFSWRYFLSNDFLWRYYLMKKFDNQEDFQYFIVKFMNEELPDLCEDGDYYCCVAVRTLVEEQGMCALGEQILVHHYFKENKSVGETALSLGNSTAECFRKKGDIPKAQYILRRISEL